MRHLLARTLDALDGAGIGGVLVVTRNADARAMAVDRGLEAMGDPGRGPNVAVGRAARMAAGRGATQVAVIAADLPLVSPQDIVALVREAAEHRLVIAPDRLGAGTNAVLTPAGDFPYSFGPDSFRRHGRAALARGWSMTAVRSPGLATDLDSPWDLDLAAAVLARAQRPTYNRGRPTPIRSRPEVG